MASNADYMYMAYGVAAVAYALYSLSLWRRNRALDMREEELDRAATAERAQ